MRGPKLKAFFSAGARGPETCEACGKAFVCGAAMAGCWCAEVKLSEAQREELKKKYPGCVCRECLEEFSRGGSIVASRRTT